MSGIVLLALGGKRRAIKSDRRQQAVEPILERRFGCERRQMAGSN